MHAEPDARICPFPTQKVNPKAIVDPNPFFIFKTWLSQLCCDNSTVKRRIRGIVSLHAH
jgi:hypothetical protein